MAEAQHSVHILASAQAELEEIASLYLSLVGASSARAITDKIYSALEQLARFPMSGPHIRDSELQSLGFRFTVAEKYIIIYRFIDQKVIVYHIFDGRSDYPTLLRSEMFK